MVIKRGEYIDQLVQKRGNGMVKVITGIRRCGKSYILFNLFRDYLLSTGVSPDQIIAVSLDDERNRYLREPNALYDYLVANIKDPKRMYYVLLDEAQLAISRDEAKERDIRLYGILNSMLHMGNVDVYVTGSNSEFLSSDVLTEFRGRGDQVRIYPLSFREFMSVYEGDKYSGFEEYCRYGGLPLIPSLKTDEQKSQYLKTLFQETYMKDIIERYNLRRDVILDPLIDILASSVGSLTNATKLANTLISKGIKTNKNTIATYIGYLEEAFMVSKAQRYDIKGKHYIGSPFKFYFTDVGLRNARLNFRQQEPTYILENVIYNELLIRGYNVDVGIVDYWINRKGNRSSLKRSEVDFVCNMFSKRYYIQSAFAIPDREKMAQEQALFDHIDDSFKKIIVVQTRTPTYQNENGTLIIDALDFLLNPNSLEL